MAWQVNAAVHGPRVVLGLLLLAPVALSAADADSDVVRVIGSSWVLDAPTKLADSLDLFSPPGGTGPGIDVTYASSGAEALGHLLAGEAEFALAAATPIAVALMNGKQSGLDDLVILASVGLSNQTHHVLARRDRGVAMPGDLVNRRIGVMLGTSAQHGWSLFARYHGLDDGRVELVDLPVDQITAALASGRVDAAVIWDPWAHPVRTQLASQIIEFPIRHLHIVNWLVVSRRAYVRQHPETADRVIAGYRDAIDLILREPDDARRVYAAASGLAGESLEQLEAGVIWSLGLNLAVLADMEAQFDWLLQSRPAGARAAPLPSEYLEPAPLARVAPERLALPAYLYHSQTGGGSPP